MLQNDGWCPQRRHPVKRIDSCVGQGLDDDSNNDRIGFQLLWLKRVDKSLAHEATQHAIVYRGGVLRDVTCMMHMFNALIAVDSS